MSWRQGILGRRRRTRRAAISLCVVLSTALTSLPALGVLPANAQQAGAAVAATGGHRQHPNRFNPRTHASSVRPHWPKGTLIPHRPDATSSRRGAAKPYPFHRDMSAGFRPMIERLGPRGGRFLSRNGGLEVDVPAEAVTPADVAVAGGSMRLLVRQVEPASGGSAGGSGRDTFGTFLIQVLDSRGRLAHGLRHALVLRLHVGKRARALDLARTQVVINGGLPPWVNLAPASVPGVAAGHAPPRAMSRRPTLPRPAHEMASLNAKNSTLSANVPLADSTTVVSWDTDAAVATFGKPDPSTVDLSGGSLNMSFPIDAPAGPGGLKPPLTLSYGSAAVAEAHGVQSAAPWVGEGWSLGLGSISWAQFNVQDLPSNDRAPQWEQRWQLNDPFGTAAELIPPNVFASTYFNDSPNPITPGPVQWHAAPETHAKIFSITSSNTLPGQDVNPPCFRVFLTNGIMEEFGCTPDSLQYYPGSGGHAFIANWLLDMITDPKGNQIHITYQSDMATGPGGMSYPRDTVPATVEYDSPGCTDAQHACTGADWTPLLRVNFVASHTVGHPAGSTCPPSGNLRCDDPADLSGSNGVAAPLVQSTFVLNDVQVQIRPDGNSPWNTLRDYQLGYDQSAPTTFTDPVSGTQESAAGKLILTRLQAIGDDGSTSLPARTFGYTEIPEYYEDTQASPTPASNCGPAFNTGAGAGTTGCPIWNQSRDGNSFYLTSASNGLGLAQSFTYQLARNNTHDPSTGPPGGGADPFFCTNADSGIQASYPCDVADDEAWSRVVLTQKTNSMVRLFENPSGSGVSQREIDSTTSYAYKIPAISAQPCPDCSFGLYWGNQNDFDFLDFYNYRFMGFAQATIANPDGSSEIHTFNSGEGIGIYSSDTSQIACDPAVRFPCHRDPWWDVTNAAHGMEKQVDTFNSDGTPLTRTTTSYAATCPPTGVPGSPNNIGWGSWDGMLVSEVDHSNPMAVCDVKATQQDAYTIDGSASPSVPHATVTSTYDSFGRLTSQTTASNNGGANGSPTTIVKNTGYVQNDGVTATATSATGPYLINFPAFQDTEDAFGNRYQCTYTSYDGQANTQGQTPQLTTGEVTRTDQYTNCGDAANNFTPSGQISQSQSYDVHGNQITTTDPDASAGNRDHRGCTVDGAQFTTCSTYDPTFAFLPTAQSNALNQTTTTGYQPAATADASGGFGLWPVSTTNLNGQTTTTSYDALGRPVSQTLPGETAGQTTMTTTYTDWCSGTGPQGACVEIDHSQRINGTTTVTSRAFFDGLGHLTETRVPAPGGRDVVRYSFYDEAQRLAFQSNAYFVPAYTGPPGEAAFSPPDTTVAGTTHSYLSMLSTVTVDSLSNQTTTSKSVVCGAAGTGDSACYEQDLTVDPLGHQEGTLIDAQGRKAYQQLYTGNSPSSYAVYATAKYAYDFQGNLTGVVEPDGTSKITFRYDMAGRKTGMTDPDRGTENYVLDQNGNQIQTTDARGSAGTVFIGYDALNRPLWKNASASTPAGAFVTYSYDSTANRNFGVGQLTSETFTSAPNNSLSGSSTYRYDSRGRQVGTTLTVGNASYTLRTSYDDAGNVLTQVYPDGETVTNSYSPEAWLSGVQTQRGSYPATALVSGIRYTGPGGATGEMTGASLGGGTFAYSASFDGMLRNSDVTIKNSFGTVLFGEVRSFDGVGNVTTENTTLWPVGTDNQAFCYDEQNRLTWAGSRGTPPCTGTKIDAGSNLLARYTQSFGYDNMGRLTQGPHGSYAYTDPAHVHGATAIGDDWTAAYDATGDMVCHAPSDFTTCAGPSQTGEQLSYDHTGQLASWRDRPNHPGSTASFLYDGQGQRVAQRITQFGDTKLIVYVGGVEEVATDDGITTTSTFYYANSLRMATAVNGHISYLANDALGSADAALSDGIVTASQLFAPYGELRFQLGIMPTTFGFTGQRGDAVSGLDYYGARYYDPMAGQFTSADTVLEGNGMDILALSRYAYVAGNPEIRTDATGHCPWCVAAVVGAAIGAGIAYGSQVANNLQHGQSLGSALTHVDGGEIAKAALVGAVIGATGGLAGGAVIGALGADAAATTAGTIASTVASGAVSGGAGQLTDNVLNGRQWDDNLAQATAEGAVLGPLAEYGGRYAGGYLRSLLSDGDTAEAIQQDATTQAESCSIGAGNSFAKGTKVLMANGKKKPINRIRPGDRVLTGDAETRHLATPERVEQVIIGHGLRHLVDVTIRDETIEATYNHPFWVTNDGRFEWATNLKVGDHLLLASGKIVPILRISRHDAITTVYNLSVSQIHTFFVGNRSVLVHNSCSIQHMAHVTIVDKNGNVRYDSVLILSGNMTPEERALGFPLNMLVTHTEQRAIQQFDIQEGDTVLIEGRLVACGSCQRAMQNFASESGSFIIYTGGGQELTYPSNPIEGLTP